MKIIEKYIEISEEMIFSLNRYFLYYENKKKHFSFTNILIFSKNLQQCV